MTSQQSPQNSPEDLPAPPSYSPQNAPPEGSFQGSAQLFNTAEVQSAPQDHTKQQSSSGPSVLGIVALSLSVVAMALYYIPFPFLPYVGIGLHVVATVVAVISIFKHPRRTLSVVAIVISLSSILAYLVASGIKLVGPLLF